MKMGIMAEAMSFQLQLVRLNSLGHAARVDVRNLSFDRFDYAILRDIPEMRRMVEEKEERKKMRLQREEMEIQAKVLGKNRIAVVELGGHVINLVERYQGVIRSGWGVCEEIEPSMGHGRWENNTDPTWKSLFNIILGTVPNVPIDRRARTVSDPRNWGKLEVKGK